ncbi:uncharacterized protein LOC117581145 [Drosophila guanche]|uniref:Enkurin domain-containing protein n=1 Tax=Drosophila guanche TaxID=7266 RepID=A0A3B0JY11_DROGU|nr:uncharacterized protein LOC117581145 [Drosophila guanche]SPP78246.1 Hypothetical predicted protein [Drosophila guanche]
MFPKRNFLLENRLLAARVNQSSVRPPLKYHSYEMPTAASLARRTAPATVSHKSALVERPRRSCSEKQIQTDDICDEVFLSAALLKCSEHGQTRATHSEGDECSPPLTLGLKHISGGCLRSTTSNFELGRVAEQRCGCQAGGQYTLHRLLGSVAGTVAGSELDQLDDSSSIGSGDSSRVGPPRVRQAVIPEITDVDQEDPLSARSRISKCSELSSGPAASTEVERLSEGPEAQQQPQLEQQQAPQVKVEDRRIPLSEAQRTELIEESRGLRSLLIAEWNRLPLSTATLRVRNLKRQLEQKLDIVDKDLSVLSQQRVYVKQASSDSARRFFH